VEHAGTQSLRGPSHRAWHFGLPLQPRRCGRAPGSGTAPSPPHRDRAFSNLRVLRTKLQLAQDHYRNALS